MIDPTDIFVGAGAAATGVIAVWKVVIPVGRWFRRLGDRMSRALDVVLGTPEVPDPDRPGKLLRDAVPDIGVRVTSVETVVRGEIVGAVTRAEAAAKSAETQAAEAKAAAVQAAQSAASAARDAARALAAVSPEP